MPSAEDVRYAPGDTALVCVRGAFALVDLPVGSPLVEQVYEALSGRGGLDDALDVLVSPGLRAVASFALASWADAGCRVVVRGSYSAQGPTGAVEPQGLWSDSSFSETSPIRLTAADPGDTWLPLVDGIVGAAAVRRGAASGAEAVAAASVAGTDGVSGPEAVAEEAPSSGASQPDSSVGFGAWSADADAAYPAWGASIVPEPASEPAVDLVPEPAPAPAEPTPAPAEPMPAPAEPMPAPAEPMPAPIELAPAVSPPPPASGGLLITGLPWALSPDDGSSTPSASSAPSGPPSPFAPPGEPSTFAPPVEPSAFTPPVEPSDAEVLEMTIDRRNLIGHASPAETMVVAAKCPSGHLTPAYAGKCRVCGQMLPPQQPFETARPPLGTLRLSNGDRVTLDRGIIMGRNPHLPTGYTGEQPNLIKLSDPQKDISSQHLEVSLDFWHVLVTDLGSTNGTEVVLPGRPPVRLIPHDPMMIEPGTRVILAGVQDFVFEVTG